MRYKPIILMLLALNGSMCVACGARTGLEGAAPDGDGDVEIVEPESCRSWVATHAPVQISGAVGSMDLQTLLPVSSCLLVGYGNIDYPPNDSNWRVRQICFGNGALGSAHAVLHRDFSELGWTAISLAHGFGRMAATAWDEATGMHFVRIDETGAPVGSPVWSSDLPGRDLLATPSGYTVLQNLIHGVRAPVVLTSLDSSGNVVGASLQIIDDSATVNRVSRFAYDDRSFLVVWTAEDSCEGCRTLYAHHLGEAGDAIAPRVLLRSFAADEYRAYSVAPSALGFAAAWFEASEDGRDAVISAFGANGDSMGPPSILTSWVGLRSETVTLGPAPAGDVIAAWSRHIEELEWELVVQALTPMGIARGDEVVLGTFRRTNNGVVRVIATEEGAMVLYENEVPGIGSQIYAIPMRCGD